MLNLIRFGGMIRRVHLPFLITFVAFLGLTISARLQATNSCKSPNPDNENMINPVIMFDQGHHNYGNAESFAVINVFLSQQGFTVSQGKGPVEENLLQSVDIFHTSNALALENRDNWALPTPSAYAPEEISILTAWVREGGSLLMDGPRQVSWR